MDLPLVEQQDSGYVQQYHEIVHNVQDQMERVLLVMLHHDE